MKSKENPEDQDTEQSSCLLRDRLRLRFEFRLRNLNFSRAQDVTIIQQAKWAKVSDRSASEYDTHVLVGAKAADGSFRAGQTACSIRNEIFLTEKARQVLGVQSGQDVYYTLSVENLVSE